MLGTQEPVGIISHFGYFSSDGGRDSVSRSILLLASCSCVSRFWSKLPLWETHTQGGKQMKPSCSETTGVSGRIFQKPSSSPFLPERTMSPKKIGPFLPLEKAPGKEAAPSPRYLPMHRQLTRKLSFCSLPASGLFGVALAFSCESGSLCLCPSLSLKHLSYFPTTWLHLATKTGFWQLGKSKSQCGKASDI